MKLSDKDTAILNLILEYLPYYGEFDIHSKVKYIENDKFKEAFENLGNPTGQLANIRDFLVDHGYAFIHHGLNKTDIAFDHIELTKRGRWLKECGSMESYREYQAQKKRDKIAADLEIVQRNKRDKHQYWINFWIAAATCVAAIGTAGTLFFEFLKYKCPCR